MCGIVAAVAAQNIVPILVQGLQRLEYRGYDSCGVAVYAEGLKRARSTSRVAELGLLIERDGITGHTGIAHTRWATHGAPAVHNAHPHFSHGAGADAMDRAGRIALVHNGIIENHEDLRAALQAKGLCVRQPDGYRSHCPLGGQLVYRRLIRRRESGRASVAWRLCDCRVLQG
jgi:glucosamine--fructose-6-phosphate aminotransferase (isomerizing)